MQCAKGAPSPKASHRIHPHSALLCPFAKRVVLLGGNIRGRTKRVSPRAQLHVPKVLPQVVDVTFVPPLWLQLGQFRRKIKGDSCIVLISTVRFDACEESNNCLRQTVVIHCEDLGCVCGVIGIVRPHVLTELLVSEPSLSVFGQQAPYGIAKIDRPRRGFRDGSDRGKHLKTALDIRYNLASFGIGIGSHRSVMRKRPREGSPGGLDQLGLALRDIRIDIQPSVRSPCRDEQKGAPQTPRISRLDHHLRFGRQIAGFPYRKRGRRAHAQSIF